MMAVLVDLYPFIPLSVARLNRIWRCNSINFASKFKLFKSLSPQASSTAVKHGPCSLTMKKKKKNPGFRNQVLKETSYLLLEHMTDWMQSKINFLVGLQEPLLATVKRRKLA